MASHVGKTHGKSSHSIEDFGAEAYSGWAPNAVLLDALNSDRGDAVAAGRVLPGAVTATALATKFTTAAPPLDDPTSAAKTAPDARRDTALAELLAPLCFDPGFTAARVADADGFALHVVTPSVGPAALTFTSAPLAFLHRPTRAQLNTQLARVLASVARRAQPKSREILAQVGPPASFWSARLGITPERTPYTLDLLYLAQRLAAVVAFRFKYAFATPRPFELSPQVQPILAAPGHGSFPAGHSTEAFACAEVLRTLTNQTAGSEYDNEFQKLALLIAFNRVIAGLHFEIDNIAGRTLGVALGNYFLVRSGAIPGWTPLGANAAALAGDAVLDIAQPLDGSQTDQPGLFRLAPVASSTTRPSPVLVELWARASAEMQLLGF